MDDLLRNLLFREYQSGLTIRQLAERHKIGWAEVQKNLSRVPHWNQRKRKRKHGQRWAWPEKRKNAVVALYNEGYSIQSVARQLHAKAAIVREILKERKIQIRHQGEAQTGRHNGYWKGGRRLIKGYWYVYMPDHQNATSHGIVLEHRLVMEKVLGRILSKDEVVHHKDKNPQNNNPNNLELYSSNASHLKSELIGCCPKWTEDGNRRIAEGIRKSVKRRQKNGRSKADVSR